MRVLSAFACAGVIAGSASAADLPTKKSTPAFIAPAAYNWSGGYIGLNAGAGWGQDNGDPICLNPTGVLNGAGCHVTPGSNHTSAAGFIGGGQVGYNWQFDRWVLGLEADLQGASINGSNSYAGALVGIGAAPATGAAAWSEKMDLFGTARGRVGFALDRTLIYATGGLAYGQVSTNSSFAFASGVNYQANGNTTRAGWAIGGGVEYAFLGNWSAKIEGLYYDLGSVSIQGPAAPAPIGLAAHGKTFDLQGEVARVGLNYKFW